jgi:ABC-2 type transport system ATP-binding protein
MAKAEVSAVEIRALAKTFRGRRRLRSFWKKGAAVEALRGVDLDVERGELVAVLGPNGAGKTTMLKILATLITPSAGTVRVEGIDLAKDPELARDRLGYVLTDERSFYWRISVYENLRFFAALQGLAGAKARARIETLASLVGITEQLPRDFADLSSGQRQRAAIARGLLSDPPVVMFDEATRSLDPGRAEHLRRVIREVLVEREQKAVLFATHDLVEARALADRVVLMAEGKIVRVGPYAEIEDDILKLFREEAGREEAELFRLFPDLAERSGRA